MKRMAWLAAACVAGAIGCGGSGVSAPDADAPDDVADVGNPDPTADPGELPADAPAEDWIASFAA